MRWFVSILITVVLGVSAAGWFEADAQQLKKVSLRLNWTALGENVPFYVALEKGYYKEAGLDVTIGQGKGSGSTIQLVGSGADTFGYAEMPVAAKFISQGLPVKVVYGVHPRGFNAIVFHNDGTIKTPKDLKGKTVCVSPGDAQSLLFPGFLKAAGMTPQDLKIQTVDPGLKFRLLGQRSVDATVTLTVGIAYVENQFPDVKLAAFEYADYGLNLPGYGLIVSTKTLQTSPDVVRAFNTGTARGWLDAERDPDGAIAILKKHFPQVTGSDAMHKRALLEVVKHMRTPETAGKPLGWMSPDIWKRTHDLLVEYFEMKPQASLDAFYTNELVPAVTK